MQVTHFSRHGHKKAPPEHGAPAGQVDEVVAEEDLRGRSTGSTVLGHIVRTDVDGGVVRLFDELDGHGLTVSAGYTVAPRPASWGPRRFLCSLLPWVNTLFFVVCFSNVFFHPGVLVLNPFNIFDLLLRHRDEARRSGDCIFPGLA